MSVSENACDLPAVKASAGTLAAIENIATREPKGKLRFSLSFFANDDQRKPGRENYQLLLEASKYADENGFESVWFPERHFHAFGGLFPNPSVLAAALATTTETIGLRAGSVVAPLHHPIRIAEEWAVVDNLSNGRVGISFASGWNANDFILSSSQFEARRETTADVIDIVRRLWHGEELDFSNGRKMETIKTFPRPVQSSLPFWLTCSGRLEGFVAAAKMGANVLTHLRGQDIEEIPEKIEVYRRIRRESGYAGEGMVTLMMHTYVHEDAGQVIEDIRKPLQAYLGSSLDLSQMATKRDAGQLKSSSMSSRLREAMLTSACERYMKESGLFGTPQDILAQVEYLDRAGVNEVACLVDFGVEQEKVMRSLRLLGEICRHRQPSAATTETGHALLAQSA